MKCKTILLSLILNFVLNGCVDSNKKNNLLASYQFEDLFNTFLHENDSIIITKTVSLLEDSVNSFKFPRFISYEIMDSLEQEPSLYFEFSNIEYEAKLAYRNIYQFFLTRNNEIICDPKRFNNCSSVIKDLEEFIFNPLDEYELPQKVNWVDPFGDTIRIIKSFLFINAAMIPDSLGKTSSWLELRELILQTNNYYDSIRMNYSFKKWGVKFDDLELKQKIHITEVIPKKMIIHLNLELEEKGPRPEMPAIEDVLDINVEMDSLIIDKSLL